MTGMTSLANAPVSREAIADYLERRIVCGELPPGTKLPSERQLAEHFGISRPIVREALRALVERNLVEVLPARGAFVRDIRLTDAANQLDTIYRRSPATPRHLVEARTMLECTAATLAADRATPADLDAIRTAMQRCEEAATVLDQARYDLAFHLAIVRAAANPVIEVMFSSISSLSVELMIRSLSDRKVKKESLPYHRAIFDAISDHDAVRAERAMSEHLEVARRFYGSDYDAPIESVARRELARIFPPGVTLEDLLAVSDGEFARSEDG
jgi:DNA-binding FadR family transcriptional regulator